MSDLAADVAYTCPRCGTEVTERLWGPCTSCRAELRATLGTEARDDVVAAEYVPKVNVVANNVASARED
jgi:DNA-directed RNA polymerase subunit RPC12/RpoP